MSRTSEVSKKAEEQGEDDGRLPETSAEILGLRALSRKQIISPEHLWADSGVPFPRPLLVKFKEFTGACSLIQKTKKE